MNPDISNIVHHLFPKKTLGEVHFADIEQMVNEYPYFAPAQYLLTKKYLQANDSAYGKQAKKTALFFSNPHWLNALLVDDEIRLDDGKWMDNADKAVNADVITHVPVEEAVLVTEIIAEPAETLEEKYETVTEEATTIVHDKEPSQDISGVVFMEEVSTVADEVVENKPGKTDEEIELTEEIPVIVQPEETSFSDDIKTGDVALTPDNTLLTPKLKLILDQEVPPETDAESIIPIEPLYTIDYFASQGIKADAADAKDRLSLKLRSFTDWLKTMKRIHPEKFDTSMDPNSQSAIQNIAEHSNELKETVTETMAEVFARQGLHKKAAEVYHKLSLLNPDKRVYFAAKIAQLKET